MLLLWGKLELNLERQRIQNHDRNNIKFNSIDDICLYYLDRL